VLKIFPPVIENSARRPLPSPDPEKIRVIHPIVPRPKPVEYVLRCNFPFFYILFFLTMQISEYKIKPKPKRLKPDQKAVGKVETSNN
jgi:hypothetical protein